MGQEDIVQGNNVSSDVGPTASSEVAITKNRGNRVGLSIGPSVGEAEVPLASRLADSKPEPKAVFVVGCGFGVARVVEEEAQGKNFHWRRQIQLSSGVHDVKAAEKAGDTTRGREGAHAGRWADGSASGHAAVKPPDVVGDQERAVGIAFAREHVEALKTVIADGQRKLRIVRGRELQLGLPAE